MFDESLITSEVCVQCGACCSVYVKKGTAELVALDDIKSPNDIEVIACRHLQVKDSRFTCGDYENRPNVCREFNCLAKANQNPQSMCPSKALASRVRATVQTVHGRGIEVSLVK